MSKEEKIIITGEYEGANINKKSGIKTLKFKFPHSEFPAYIMSGVMIGRLCDVVLKQEKKLFKLGKMSFGGLNIKKVGDAQLKLESENVLLDQLDEISDEQVVKVKIVFDKDEDEEELEEYDEE